MRDRILARGEWKTYFDVISRMKEGRRVEVEIDGLDLGSQREVLGERAMFQGISYDPREDILFVHTDTMEHMISSPREIYVLEIGPWIAAVGVRDAENHLNIVKLRVPLMIQGQVAVMAAH